VSEVDKRSWLRPPNLIAGGVTAAGGPALVVAGVVAPLVGGLLVIPLFLAGAGVVALLNRGKGSSAPAVAPVDPNVALLTGLDGLVADITPKVPPIVLARVERIVTTIRETLPRLDNLGPGSQQAHSVVQTAASYLPEALNGYLRLPRSFADRRPVAGGKTSLMVLCDQLDLLGNKMDEIFDAACRLDADALIAHGRFLADKFGTGELALGQTAGPLGAPGEIPGQLPGQLGQAGQPG